MFPNVAESERSNTTYSSPYLLLVVPCSVNAMDEGRKRVILIAASILCSRKLAELGFKPSPAADAAIANAVAAAVRIMRKIDSCWPPPERDRGL